MKTTHRLIKTEKELDTLIEYCKETGYASIDFETNGEHVWSPKFYPTVLGVSFQPGSGWVIPLAHKDSVFKDKWEKVFKKFATEILTNPSIIKIAWNLEFEYSICLKYGYRMRGRIFDAMMAKYLLDETRPNGLKEMVDRFLPEFSGYDLPGSPSGKSKRQTIINFWSNVEIKALAKYCAGDSDFTFRLFVYFEDQLIKQNLYRLFRSMYMPLVRILAKNRLRGIRIDRAYLQFLDKKFSQDIAKIEREIRSIPIIADYEEHLVESRVQAKIEELEDEIAYGTLSDRQIANKEEKISNLEAGIASTQKEESLFEPLNFGSPKQLGELLFESSEGFNFPIIERTESGAPSTAEDTLEQLKQYDDSGFIDKLLELRGLTKMYTTYVKNILEEQLEDNDRLHPGFIPTATVTGRFGSRNPNFQNVPRVTSNRYIKRYVLPDMPGQAIAEVDACLAGDTRISTYRGLVRMDSLTEEDQVLVQGRFYNVNSVWSTGVRPVFELTTNTGRKIKATGNHPFKTINGFKGLDTLSKGDILYIDTSIVDGELDFNYDEAYLVGLFYGDGFYSQNDSPDRSRDTHRLAFSSGLDREAYVTQIKKVFPEAHISQGRPIPEAIYITNKAIHTEWSNKYPKKGSRDMRIPDRIWQASEEAKLHFIGGLIDSDGSVNNDRIRYGSICESFIDDLLVLGNSLGIFGVKEVKPGGGYENSKISYHWIVYSKDSMARVLHYPRLARKNSMLEYWVTNKGQSHCKTEMVYEPIYGHITESTRLIGPYKPVGKTLNNGKRKNRITRGAIINNIVPYSSLLTKDWVEILGYRYELVESIIPIGDQEVFDIEVEGLHTFSANGIIVHNSQAELRTIASIADDKAMKEIFRSGKNIHVATAAKITGAEYDLINKARKDEVHQQHIWAVKEHKKAKVTNFGIIYGMSGYKLSDQLTVDTGHKHTVQEADEIIEDWFKAFPGVKRHIKETHKLAQKTGQVVSPIGRVRRLPILLNPRNKMFSKGEWNEALRQSVNGRVQGFASDITQWANINIYEATLKGELPEYILMYITVHDSLEYSIYIDDIPVVVPQIMEIAGSMKDMEKYFGGCLQGVDMKFSGEVGITWGHAHEFDPKVNYKELFEKDIEEYNKHRIENNVKPFNHE